MFRRILAVLSVLALLCAGLPAMADECIHNWKLVRNTATCTKGGTALYQCTKCHAQRRERVPALGHNYGPARIITEPTCTSAGRGVRTCSRDRNHIWYVRIPALGHDWGEWEYVMDPSDETRMVDMRVCKRDPSHVEIRDYPWVKVSGLCPAGPYHVGETISVTWTVTNTGKLDLHNGEFEGDSVHHAPTELAAGESCTWTVEHEITGEVYEMGTHFNMEGKYWDPSETYPDSHVDILASVHYEAVENGYRCYSLDSYRREILPAEEPGETPSIGVDLRGNCPEGPFAVGDTVKITWTVINTCSQALRNGTFSGDAIGNAPAELAPGESYTWTVEHKITRKDYEQGTHFNPETGSREEDVTFPQSTISFLADVHYEGADDGFRCYDLESLRRELVPNPETADLPGIEVDLTGECPEGPFRVGDTIKITWTVQNTCAQPLHNGTFSGDAFGRGPVRLTVGQSCSWTVEHTITEEDYEKGRHYNPETGIWEEDVTFPESIMVFLADVHYEGMDDGFRCYDLESFEREIVPEGSKMPITPETGRPGRRPEQ